MRLDTFLLSESASAFRGQLYIHGGGVTRVDALFVPWVVSPISLVVRIQLDPPEIETGADFELRFVRPDGEPDEQPFRLPIHPRSSSELDPEEEHYVQVCIGLGTYTFEQEGIYRFELWHGEDCLRSLALPVRVRESE